MSMVPSNAVTTTLSCPELLSSQELLVDRDNKSKSGSDFEGQVDVYDGSIFSQPSSSCPSLVTDRSEISSSPSRPGTPGARMLNEEREELVDIFAEDLELENLISSAILDCDIGLVHAEEEFRVLLSRFAKNLQRIASTKLETQIAKFVLQSSRRTAEQLVAW